MPVIINQLDVVTEPTAPKSDVESTAQTPATPLPRPIDLRRVREHETARELRVRAD